MLAVVVEYSGIARCLYITYMEDLAQASNLFSLLSLSGFTIVGVLSFE